MQEKEPSKPDLGAEGTLGQQATAGRSLDSREPVFSTDDPLLTLGGLPTGLPASDPRAAMPGWGDPDAGSRYEIQTSLGQGGMGRVDLALDRRLRRNVAIKRIRLDIQHSDVVVSRFVTEATALARLAHPHIVPIYDFGQDGQGLFLVMEYLAGGNLAELLKRNGPIPERQVLDYLIPICEALQAAHEAGIVHRDIKPGNLLIGQDGRAKLTDFGLVKMLRPTSEAPEDPTLPPSITASGIPLGTVDYMPPEQRQAADRVDARSDLWSLAATAYALLTGESPRTIRLDRLPAPWRPILSRGLEEDPDRRFTSAAEFRQALLSLSSMAHAPSTSTVVVGQCPHCQSLNESQRRFCHTCSRPLYRECRTCRSEMAVWYDVCGECGQRHSDWVAQRRRQLLDWQQQAEAAAQQGNYLLAQKWIQEIRSASDEETATLTPWLQTFVPEVEQKLQAQRIEVTRLVRLALEALQQYNYAEAVTALAQIPTSVHGTVVPATGTTIDQLWRQTQTQAATVERLEGEIRRRVKEKRLKQLLPLVEEFLLLQPTHAKILKLSEQLRARELPAAVTPVAEMARAPLYLQSSFNPPEVAAALPDVERRERSGSSRRWALLMAGTAVGVVLLAGVAWAWWGQSVPDPGAATGAPSVSASAPAAIEPTIINSVGMTLQWIPPGSLRMGSPLDEVGRLADEEPQTLSIDGYYLGAFEVSVAQYHRVMDLAPPPATEADLPKTDLTWEQAVAFCERLTRQPAEFQARRRYYLPSEPQWEYARRAGQKSPFALDVELEQLPEYQAAEEGRLLPCNATTPNAWGIHGLAGNAREWTSNWYAPNLSVFRVRPLGPAGGQERSV